MSDFPKRGGIEATRIWLDKKGFFGSFIGWKADAILSKSEEFIKSEFPGTDEGQDKAEILCGLLNTARTQSHLSNDMNIKILLHIKKKVDRIDWIIRFADFCPWLDMVETEVSPANRLRVKVFSKLGITDATATCWVTGKHVAVKNALIIPDGAKNKVMKRLKLEPKFRTDVEAVPSNFMILDTHLKDAFDCLKISFSPVDVLHTEQLRLKIWDPSCRNDPVGHGLPAEMLADVQAYGRELTTIGDYENFPLNIPATWKVSRRALSYHTLCCYIYQKYKGNLSLDENMPADFSSETAHGRDTMRRELASLFKSSIREDDDLYSESLGELGYDAEQDSEPEDLRTARKKKQYCVIM